MKILLYHPIHAQSVIELVLRYIYIYKARSLHKISALFAIISVILSPVDGLLKNVNFLLVILPGHREIEREHIRVILLLLRVIHELVSP